MKKLIGLLMFTLLVVAGCTEPVEETYEAPLKEMTVHFIDVGQGIPFSSKHQTEKRCLLTGA